MSQNTIVDIPDIAIISSTGQRMFDIMITKFVGRNKSSTPIRLETYNGINQTFLIGDVNLFPNKLLNLEGRPLTLTLIDFPPYAVWRKTVSFFFQILYSRGPENSCTRV